MPVPEDRRKITKSKFRPKLAIGFFAMLTPRLSWAIQSGWGRARGEWGRREQPTNEDKYNGLLAYRRRVVDIRSWLWHRNRITAATKAYFFAGKPAISFINNFRAQSNGHGSTRGSFSFMFFMSLLLVSFFFFIILLLFDFSFVSCYCIQYKSVYGLSIYLSVCLKTSAE